MMQRGFQRMSAARRREIARAGGRAAQAQGSAHRWTSDEARVAGKKGGRAAARSRRGGNGHGNGHGNGKGGSA
jgi:hypothetical protein